MTVTTNEVLEYTDPRPATKKGRVRIALMQLYEEHRRAGMLPTSWLPAHQSGAPLLEPGGRVGYLGDFDLCGRHDRGQHATGSCFHYTITD